ncbi:small nuclear ribonucleoprotein D3 [Acrasis kona]|uniref:Small nuclear ribonucleoprotein Sm D3 n=1 Tax=Acrasis kona TaxID=1008807 RepID=A0AAW2YP11_9EUKA
MSIGIPIKLLHEAQGHIVSLETKNGEVYRGQLIESEDNMNVQLSQVTLTHRNGQTSSLESAFVRGSKIRFFVLPDRLKDAPMFNILNAQQQAAKGSGRGYGAQTTVSNDRGARGRGMGFGVGRGRSAAMRARGRGGGRGGPGRGGTPYNAF